jgi:hypothetical protein
MDPSPSNRLRSAPALVRLPLWPMAMGPRAVATTMGCALATEEAPAVA